MTGVQTCALPICALDHSIAESFTWTADALYYGSKVYDDTHKNQASGWNGDSVQLMFTDSARSVSGNDGAGPNSILTGQVTYNYGLHDDGEANSVHHEFHPCPPGSTCTEAAMVRYEDTKITVYEIKIPAYALGVDMLTAGLQFGLSTCTNDGDSDTGAGQGGWSGWAPYGIVHGGKDSQSVGLANLSGAYTSQNLADFVPTQTAPGSTSDTTTAGSTDAGCRDMKPEGATGSGCIANALDQDALPEVDDMLWEIPAYTGGMITLDAELSDWDGIAYKSQSPFRPCDKDAEGVACTAPFVEFDICTACVPDFTWSGIWDHSEATAFAWTPAALYCGMKVYDDTHQNPGSGWNGDSVQVMFTNEARSKDGNTLTNEMASPGGIVSFNYGLHDTGDYSTEHQSTPCEGADHTSTSTKSCTGFAAKRIEDKQITIYEYAFMANSFGLDVKASRPKIGRASCRERV